MFLEKGQFWLSTLSQIYTYHLYSECVPWIASINTTDSSVPVFYGFALAPKHGEEDKHLMETGGKPLWHF